MFKNKLASPSQQKNVSIIGSGITGLVLGAMLSRKGYKVTILESNPVFIGGHARSFSVEGIEFCAGPQFLWEFGKGDIGYRVLEFLNLESKISMVPLNNKAQNYYQVGNDSGMLLPTGISGFKNKMLKKFPDEEEAIEDFFEYFDSLFQASKHLEKEGLYMADYSDMRSSIALSGDVSFGAKLDVWKLAKKTLQETFDICELSKEAQKYLYSSGGVFAEPANELSIGVYVAAMGHIYTSAYVPRHGFKHMINALVGVIKAGGGDVLTNNKVIKAVVSAGSIIKLETESGNTFSNEYVISTLSPRLTCKLISQCDKDDFDYSPSNSLTSVFVGVKATKELLEKLKGRFNWWNAEGNNLDFANPDMLKPPVHLYAGSQTALKSSNIAEGTVIDLTIFAPGNFEQSRKTANRGKSIYNSFKERVIETVLKTTEQYLIPGLRENIVFTEIKTPWDIYQDLGVEKGNVYGRRLNPDSVLSAVKTINSVDNLTIANASVGLPGIATCFNTANIFFEELTGEKI
ncbi:MAG: NAD(P)/FAD-dependent oxidoreductase [Bacteroidota bacterium]